MKKKPCTLRVSETDTKSQVGIHSGKDGYYCKEPDCDGSHGASESPKHICYECECHLTGKYPEGEENGKCKKCGCRPLGASESAESCPKPPHSCGESLRPEKGGSTDKPSLSVGSGASQEKCKVCGRNVKGIGEFRHCPVGHFPEKQWEALPEIEKLLKWVQEEMVEPFSEDEIMGDHRIIVDLYNACCSLRSCLDKAEEEKSLLRKGSEDREIEFVELLERCEKSEKALRECAKSPGSCRRIVSQVLPPIK